MFPINDELICFRDGRLTKLLSTETLEVIPDSSIDFRTKKYSIRKIKRNQLLVKFRKKKKKEMIFSISRDKKFRKVKEI